MLTEQTVAIDAKDRAVKFFLLKPDGDLADASRRQLLAGGLDRSVYRCECGKFETRKFIAVESEDEIPQGILASMVSHAEECRGKAFKAANGY